METFEIKFKGEERGPFTKGQLHSMWNNGLITSDCVYRVSGQSNWQPVIAIMEIEGSQLSKQAHSSFAPVAAPITNEGQRTVKKRLSVTKELGLGGRYRGRVILIKEFGAFVELRPGREGLVPISELADFPVKRVEDVVKLGEVIWVKCIAIDERTGVIKLSRKAAMKEEVESASVLDFTSSAIEDDSKTTAEKPGDSSDLQKLGNRFSGQVESTTSMTCPECNSPDVYEATVAYAHGTVHGGYKGSSITGDLHQNLTFGSHRGRTTQRTGFAISAAPPPQPQGMNGCGTVAVVGSLIVFVPQLACWMNNWPSGWTWWGWVLLFVVCIFVYLIKDVSSDAEKMEAHQKAIAEWRNSWICNRCAHKWVPGDRTVTKSSADTSVSEDQTVGNSNRSVEKSKTDFGCLVIIATIICVIAVFLGISNGAFDNVGAQAQKAEASVATISAANSKTIALPEDRTSPSRISAAFSDSERDYTSPLGQINLGTALYYKDSKRFFGRITAVSWGKVEINSAATYDRSYITDNFVIKR